MHYKFLPSLIILAFLTSCATTQVSSTVLSSYDAAVSIEIVALKTGKLSPAQATTLANLRKKAYAAVQAVVAAEANGGTANPSVQNAATAAIAAYLSAAQSLGG